MSAPFFKYGMFGDETSLIVAFLIGIAFGFVLERAGFGNARILAAQFYFRELRVLKVMFTAIVTAMVGVYVLSRAGLLDLSLVYLTPTFILPQVVGGLILGVGFIIGGYCPGTSCVSAATGRVDGIVFLAGMVIGLLGFAEVYPLIERFTKVTPMGQVTLPQLLDVPYGVVVLLVVLMALGAFVAAEWAEKRFGGKQPDAGALSAPTRSLTPVRRFAIVLVGAGVFAAVAGNPYRGPFARIDTVQLALDMGSGANRVPAQELAGWLIEGRNDFLLVDVRDSVAFDRYHLPGAINVPAAQLRADVAPRAERIVCYSETEAMGAEAAILLRSLGFSAAYVLEGGLDAWKASVLFPQAPATDAPPAEKVDFARRSSIARHFGGAPRMEDGTAETPSAPLPVIAPAPSAATENRAAKPRKKKEGC